MPDTRRHRGPHPEDAELFAPAVWPALRAAVADLSWLLSRGYAENSALKLVGDRLQLTERQRIAVMRPTCSDQALQHRHQTQVPAERLAGERLDIDGFNVLTTVEAALARRRDPRRAGRLRIATWPACTAAIATWTRPNRR